MYVALTIIVKGLALPLVKLDDDSVPPLLGLDLLLPHLIEEAEDTVLETLSRS